MGRTPFHYSAICNDGGQYYDLLKQHGADSSIVDSVIKRFIKPLGKGQRYTYRVLQTIHMKLILLWVWAERAVLGRAKTALKFKY